MVNPVVQRITEALELRSQRSRAAYLARLEQALEAPKRAQMSCSNFAHTLASASDQEKLILRQGRAAHVAIISSYNDMLSAHAPYRTYPEQIKAYLASLGSTAQVAAGVPAMCDGITQGAAGMQLSLFSRDLIAQATAIGLSHGVFDGGLYLGVCDKIVPGLLIGALTFGHLPAVFVPAGPMASGIANAQKAAVRQRYAKGEASREELLAIEQASYHSQGTCTFYGTANTNQLLMEMMGLHVPGAAFIHPQSPLRERLTCEASKLLLGAIERRAPLGVQINAKVLINAAIGWLASGGSTNHALHLPAIAQAAGYQLLWEDLAALAEVVPLLARVYPNGAADVNQFQAAGGPGWVIRELLDADLLHGDVQTVAGSDLGAYTREPILQGTQLTWRELPQESVDTSIVRTHDAPFTASSGMHLVEGNLGRAILKTSAVASEFWSLTAPCKVFASEAAVHEAYAGGQLTGDFILVVRFQGPRANGMPELHQLMPLLANLQAAGQRVALVTDGRLSGASGKVAAAIHLTPEAAAGGLLAKVQDGDSLTLDARTNRLVLNVSHAQLDARQAALEPHSLMPGFGLELFSTQRRLAARADQGGGWLHLIDEQGETLCP